MNYLRLNLQGSELPTDWPGFSGKKLGNDLVRRAYITLLDTSGTNKLPAADVQTIYSNILSDPMLLPCLGVVDNKPVAWFVPEKEGGEYQSVAHHIPALSTQDPLVEHTMQSLRQVKAMRSVSDTNAVDELIESIAKKMAHSLLQTAMQRRHPRLPV